MSSAFCWLLAALLWPIAASPQTASQMACDLLTPGELAAVIGESVGHVSGKEIPYRKNPQLGIDHDGVLYECVESVGARKAKIRYSTSQITTGARSKAEAVGKDAQQAMRNLGYKIEFKQVDGSSCTTILPFADAKGSELLPVGTTCVLDRGGYFVSIMVSGTSPSDVLRPEKVALLAEKAASRFPR
jgi:hypothetical protein